MSARVLKYEIPEPNGHGFAFVKMPRYARPISVGLQNDHMVVWAQVPLDVPDFFPAADSVEERTLVVTNTGAEAHIPPGAEFLGTLSTDNGIVWHVWDAYPH